MSLAANWCIRMPMEDTRSIRDKGSKGICTPRALTAHLIGSIMSITGTVQPGDKFLHAILPKHHF
jgi:hypothetical protein